MVTKPLYLEDSYLKKNSALIAEVSTSGKTTKITLDQTVFYPEGGGQPSDQGTIKSETGSLKVSRVYLSGQKIIHEGKLEGNFTEGQEVEAEIDWGLRYIHMQTHSAGHIIHEAVKLLIPDAQPIEGQHGKQTYIKYSGSLSRLLEDRIKLKANDMISQDLPILTEFVSLAELQKRSSWIPPKLPTNKPLRIMWIGDFEPIPDGGTQVRTTSEIPYFSSIEIKTDPDCSYVYYHLSQAEAKAPVPKEISASSLTKDQLLNLKSEAIAQIIRVASPAELEELRIHYLGKKGALAEMAKQLPSMSLEQKKDYGQLFNDIKSAVQSAIESSSKAKKIDHTDELDLTLPGTPTPAGVLHPITVVARELNDIFQSLGFSVADGPELENDEFNYNRLNLPPDHPARDLQDSLYIKEPDVILRTHTSSVEAHILADKTPPYRFVFPGKAYRFENLSASNNMMFFQYQGVAVGQGITLANLKSTLNTFVQMFYGPHRKSRFRCKYYPEVEPGVGVDIDCPFCNQNGCAVCKQRGWIEMVGAGMIHPNILKRVGLDPKTVTGFAWGMGLDRIVMTRYSIPDIRSLTNGDLIYAI